MATKMLIYTPNSIFCSPQFLLYWSQIFIWVSDLFMQICKFSSFAYSIWLPKWPLYALNGIFGCLPPTFLLNGSLMFIYLCLISSLINIFKFCSFEYSIWLPKWMKHAPNSIFSSTQSTILQHGLPCLKYSFKIYSIISWYCNCYFAILSVLL